MDDLCDDDAAVAWREYQLRIVNLHTTGLAEEGHDEEPEDDEQQGTRYEQSHARVLALEIV